MADGKGGKDNYAIVRRDKESWPDENIFDSRHGAAAVDSARREDNGELRRAGAQSTYGDEHPRLARLIGSGFNHYMPLCVWFHADDFDLRAL